MFTRYVIMTTARCPPVEIIQGSDSYPESRMLHSIIQRPSIIGKTSSVLMASPRPGNNIERTPVEAGQQRVARASKYLFWVAFWVSLSGFTPACTIVAGRLRK